MKINGYTFKGSNYAIFVPPIVSCGQLIQEPIPTFKSRPFTEGFCRAGKQTGPEVIKHFHAEFS